MTDTGRQVIELPASAAQQGLWLVDRVGNAPGAYIVPCAMLIEGDFSVEAARAAFEELVRRHESLRTAFRMRDGELTQVIDAPEDDEPVRLDFEVLDVPRHETDERVLLEAGRPFDLVDGPLLRIRVLRAEPLRWTLLLTVHHIVVDGTSMTVLLEEFGALYNAAVAGTDAGLDEVAFQYADFAQWQLERLTEETVEAHTAYFRRRLAGAPVLDIPTDRPRPPVQSHHGRAHRFPLPAALSKRLRELARDENATLFSTLFAVHHVLLTRYTRRADVCVGVPLSTRSLPEVQSVVGFFVNLTVFRLDTADDPTFRRLVARVQSETLDAVDHCELPFSWLVDRLRPERDLSRNPLFQNTFSLEPVMAAGLRLTGARVTPRQPYLGNAKFDLGMVVEDDGEEMAGVLEYDTSLYDHAAIERMAAQYVALAESAVAAPDTPVSALDAVSAAERRELLADGNRTAADLPQPATAAELFEEWARRTPNTPAVLTADATVSYRELNERANRLARHLRALGVGPDQPVGVSLDRSADMIVAVLAVVKAGGAYLPLVPGHPVDRLRHVAHDARARVVVTTSHFADRFADGHQVVRLDTDAALIAGQEPTDPPPSALAANLAYIIYTSGSTGVPKGIAVSHRALAARLVGIGYADLRPGESTLQLAPLSFDASVWEIWGPLLTGGSVALPRQGLPFPEDLTDALARYDLATLLLISPQLHLAAEEFPEALRGARQVIGCGDVLSPHHAAALLPHLDGRLIHAYGPTETTVFATATPLDEVDAGRSTVPIGRAIAHTTAYVVDEHCRLAPVGVPGELWVGGEGVARGYHRAPGLTASHFVADPFGPPGGRLYRTGDLVRRLPSGQLDFLGRIDGQVKVRGFRIETGEVEAVLLRHPAVRAAVVVARDDLPGGRELVAYVVAEGTPATDGELRAALRAALPDYMVPAAFVPLDAVPLTGNGKLDRHALPTPVLGGRVGDDGPRTPTEAAVRDVWFGVLGVPGLGRDQKFFEVGGNSLLVAVLLEKITELFPDAGFSLVELFEFTTYAEIAAVLDERRLKKDTEASAFDI